jgi:hypothetical protein
VRWLLLLALAGCSVPSLSPHPVPAPDAQLSRCPEGVPPPVPPPTPRTVAQLAAYAVAAEAARAQTEHARVVCADRLHQLNTWIWDHL